MLSYDPSHIYNIREIASLLVRKHCLQAAARTCFITIIPITLTSAKVLTFFFRSMSTRSRINNLCKSTCHCKQFFVIKNLYLGIFLLIVIYVYSIIKFFKYIAKATNSKIIDIAFLQKQLQFYKTIKQSSKLLFSGCTYNM